MAVRSLSMRASPGARSPARMLALLLLAATGLALVSARDILEPGAWLRAAVSPADGDPRQLLFHHSFLPRLAMSIVAGAALALAGTIFQEMLRNPLADAATLGVASGAQLALSTTMLFAPALLGFAQGGVAFAGSAVAMGLVLALATGGGRAGASLSATSLILAGLMVSLTCGAIGAVLTVLNHDYLSALFIWQSGSLVQNGWAPVRLLLLELIAAGVLAGVLVRPMALVGLDDRQAATLGLRVARVRGMALALAVALSAGVVAAVGVVGFVGLAAPQMARLLGARTLPQRLAWASALGAALLALTDQSVQLLAAMTAPLLPALPTGAVTGLLGAPTLLWLLPRMRVAELPAADEPARPRLGPRAIGKGLGLGMLLLLAGIALALTLGETPHGWRLATGEAFDALLPWRGPRVAGAAAAGAMLAMAGTLMQRMTGNPMASPEVMGVSSGAAFGVVLLMLLTPGFDAGTVSLAAGAGAVATLLALLLLAGRGTMPAERLLLTGLALASFSSAAAALMLSLGDPRTAVLLAWMAGSTYGVGAAQAAIACAVAAAALSMVPLLVRWLDVLPLGPAVARALGVDLSAARLTLLMATGVLTALATLIVGPLSFVGLMAPHMARMAGIQRPLQHIWAAAIIGGLIMLLADWLGRNLLFPWQIPAGLVATLVGAPYFLWLLRRPAP